MASKPQNSITKETKLHVAMFPWLAFGHIIPYLELSKFIAQKGHRISFISTPRNIDRLPKLPLIFASSITFVKLPLPKVDGLPPNAEATMDIRNEEMNYLKIAYDGLEPELTRFLENSLPDWIIYDFAAYWLPPAASKLGISKAFFSIINAWYSAFLLGPTDVMNYGADPRTKPKDFTIPPEWVPFETKVAYKLYETDWVLRAVKKNVTGVSDKYRSGMAVKGSDAFLLRHCNEFEGQWLKLIEEHHRKPAIPLGLMPPHMENSSNDNNQSWVSIKNWLDTQKRGSVVYAALGSEVSLSQVELRELALGLELSGVPFFWAMRKPTASTESDSIELPDGFEERVVGMGIVWKSWAPQLKILSHGSVGGFLTHCGWSSTVEGLMHGHPLIMLPFLVDQGLNARVLEDKKVGIEVPRHEQDGSFTRNSVAESVRMVMVENGGKKIKEKAKEMSLIFGDRGLHDRYINDFIGHMEKFSEKAMF